MTGRRTPAQRLRDRLYVNFGNYRRGLAWNNGRIRLPRPFEALSGQAPVVYMPPDMLQHYQHPYRQFRQDKINLDSVKDINELRNEENRIKNAYNDLQELKAYMTSKNDGKLFRYHRCLGWGGNGLAAAFEVLDKNGQKVRGVVVKTLFSGEEESLDTENHARCEHIVQLEYVDGEGLIDKDQNQITGETPSQRGSSNNDRNSGQPRRKKPRSDSEDRTIPLPPPPTAIVLELLENGDLANFIAKVREHNEQIPNRVLWNFLLCLVRMCIGLAFPPDRNEDYDGVPGPITETVPYYIKDEPSTIVHFDLDPRNIFIGGLTGKEHQITPILKLGDFGLATEVELDEEDIYYELKRHRGKHGFFAPEQFCADWDYIPRDRDQVQTHTIAGNYGAHTNVWALGLVMECLVTLCYPLIPPRPSRSSVSPPQNKANYYTYGAHIASGAYNRVDQSILSVIMRCQANLPEDRPRLDSLEDFVVKHVTNQYPGESDREILAWMNRILYDVPQDNNLQQPPNQSNSDGPPGTLGAGLKDPPVPVFYPQGIAIKPQPDGAAPVSPVALPPRDPVPFAGSFMDVDNDDDVPPNQGGQGGVPGVEGGGLGQPIAGQGQAQNAGAVRRGRGGWARCVHPYGKPM
ncbi:kinase-like domain-containing protein [Xylaria sp. FL1777]|nr:kinase-like domain-containing protein [Xylaria sp. FL1777]